MADETRPTVSSSPPSVDIQDPLPETTWFWRRIFVFGVTLFSGWQVDRAVDRLADIAMVDPKIGVPAFVDLLHWLLALVILMATYYLIAPSAEQLVKMIQMAKLLKTPGFSMQQTATATSKEGTATTTTEAGQSKPSPLPASSKWSEYAG